MKKRGSKDDSTTWEPWKPEIRGVPIRNRKKHGTPKKDLEAAVLRECLMFLRSCEWVAYVERRNTGAVQFEGGGFLRFGHEGAADIWCLIRQPLFGMDVSEDLTIETVHFKLPIEECQWFNHVEIECKRRDGKGRLNASQVKFQKFCGETGIPYFVVTSAEDLARQLRKADLLS